MAEKIVGVKKPIIPLILARPGALLTGAFVLVLAGLLGLGSVEKDPSVDAFVPSDHPAALARDMARDVFGLEDPVVIGLTAPAGESAFTPARLGALRRIDQGVRGIEGVKKNDVVSLASENAILGSGGDLDVQPIIEDSQLTNAMADQAWERFRAMPMLTDLLASERGDMLVLIVPVETPDNAQGIVQAIKQLASTEAEGHLGVHVAGVATMNARLATMVSSDTRIFVPAAILTVLMILFVALRRFKALLGPLFVIAGAAGVAIGVMGWVGAKYYLLTTALPVVIMAIAVADSLHICTYYLRARALNTSFSARDAASEALHSAWRPVTLTSVTTVAAFSGMSFGAAMQPISEFGIFAALGVTVAWILSLTALPAILILTDLKPSASSDSIASEGRVDRMVSALTTWSFNRPGVAILCVLITISLFVAFGMQAQFDYERQDYFTATDPVRIADQEINRRLGGVNFLDVIVTAKEPGGIMTTSAMSSMQALRAEMADLPLVTNVGGIDEYISLMHEVLTDAEPGSLPDRERAPAQYMFLYETSGAPEDFKQEIDYDYSRALIRAQLSTDNYASTAPTLRALENLVENWSASSGLKAEISGRVAVNVGWMDKLAENHYSSLGMALSLVFLATLLVFRSLAFSLLSTVPLLVGVAAVYASMGALDIAIAPATSMTAAIATGLGIDFGIHLISHLQRKNAQGSIGLEAFSGQYTVVARACFYSAVALGFALAVICISSAPPLRWFGMLVSIGAMGSLLGALLIVPAIWSVYYNIITARRSPNVVST
jgi:predicted RND superfamily exporter protein